MRGVHTLSRITRDDILDLYHLFPFERHPLWLSIIAGELSLEQILLAEQQHYIRSNIGRHFRKKAMEDAREVSQRAHLLLYETYKEECTDDETGPSHVELIKRLLTRGGIDETVLDTVPATPGNSAAIALYKDIGERGPLHHMIGAGAVEYFYSDLSPKIYDAYTKIYGMDGEQAETYRIHGPMDREHAERALSLIDDPLVLNDSSEILRAVRDAFVATSLHYDGMLQAARNNTQYWSGR